MKTKRMGRQCFSLPFGETVIFILVTFAMVIGLFPGMSVKAFADSSGTGVSSLSSTLTPGTYYLTGDVTISSPWTPVDGITLDLNGKTITMNGSGNAITVSNGVTLTIKDSSSSNSGNITHASNKTGRGVEVQSGGTFHMTGGSITANNCSDKGAGVYVAGTADFSKTTISRNTAASNGGGIFVDNGGTLSVADCTIDGNSTDKSNESPCGGGVSVFGTATFSGNTKITNNWTKQNSGGGIHVSGGNASITIHDNVQITGNKAFANGGGIFLKYGNTMKISGAPVIKDNKANLQNTNKVGPNLDVENLITIDGPLTGNPGDIHIFLDLGGHAGASGTGGVDTGVFTTNQSNSIDDSTPSKFTCDNSGSNVIRDGNNLSVKRKYQIAYNVNGRTGITAPNTQTADLSTSVTLATINNDYFLNWNTKKDGSGTSYNGGATITPSSNLYLYAQWHTHNWTYAASGDTITATCSGTGTCPIGNQTAKLSLNIASFTYGNTNISPTVTVSNAWTTGNGLVAPPTVSDVKYQGRGSTSYSSSSTKPTNAGDYTATLTAGDKTAQFNFTISKATNPEGKARYDVVSAQGVDHTHGDQKDAVIIVERSINDEATFDSFTGLRMDEKTVAGTNYQAEPGSLKLTMKASYLNTLSEGKHTATILFKDGQAEVTVTIRSEKADIPKTGDAASPGAWILMMLLGATGIVGWSAFRKKKEARKEDRR